MQSLLSSHSSQTNLERRGPVKRNIALSSDEFDTSAWSSLSTIGNREYVDISHDAKDVQKLPLWLSRLQINLILKRSPNAAIHVIDWKFDLKEALTAIG